LQRLQKTTSFQLPPYYLLAPTVPSPFARTLDASLDAVVEWNIVHGGSPGIQGIINALQRPVDHTTNWPSLLDNVISKNSKGEARKLVEELLFLITRTLLPEQIAENRILMGKLYDR
jgi:hypothetical protein